MFNFPLVSIIIPAFNAEKTIIETVQSCLGQTWRNIEVIIIDDGSTDNTILLIRNLHDTRIKLYQQNNKGACAARNLGISYATGTYIQFLDSDDLLSPDKIKNQVELLIKSSPLSIASCAWGRFYKNTVDFKVEKSDLNKNYSNPINWLIESWNGVGMGVCSMWLTPANLIKKAGYWNEELIINQDGEYFARVLLHANEIVFCKRSIVYYRSGNKESVSQSIFNEIKACSLLKSYQLYTLAISDKSASKDVNKALARNFAGFIYRFDTLYPDLSNIAKEDMDKLKVGNFAPVGGRIFQAMTYFFGFSKALIIRSILKFKFTW